MITKIVQGKELRRLLAYNGRSMYFSTNSRILQSLKNYNDVPGPIRLPFIGTVWVYFTGRYDINKLHKMSEDLYQRYGSIVREDAFNEKIVHIYNPDDIKTVFEAELRTPRRKAFAALESYRRSKPDLYNNGGLLPLNGDEWWRLRRRFQKPLSPIKETRDFLPSVDEVTKDFIENVTKSGEVKEDFIEDLYRYDLELIWHLLFGERINCFMGQNAELTSDLIKSTISFNDYVFTTDNTEYMWKRIKTKDSEIIFNSIETLEKHVIRAIEKVKENREERKGCLVDQYLNDKSIDEKDVLGIATDLLIGGIDSTANITSFLIYHVATNKGVDSKIKEEAEHLLRNSGSKMTKGVMDNADYTKGVLKETLRLTPISIGVARVLTRDLVLSGYRIPEKATIITHNMTASKMEKYFNNPEKFQPERWIRGSPSYKEVHPYVVMPFSQGLRSCIARRRAEQNILVFTLRMFQNRKVTWLGGELDIKTPFLNKPVQPVKLLFQ